MADYIEGRRAVEEALKAGVPIRKVFVQAPAKQAEEEAQDSRTGGKQAKRGQQQARRGREKQGAPSGADAALERVCAKLRRANVPIEVVEKAKLDRMSADGGSHGAHQGIMCEVPPYRYADIMDIAYAGAKKRDSLVLVLDHITDEGNLGAIIRTAEVMGADGVVIPSKRAAQVTVGVHKTSAGAAFHVPIARVPNLVGALKTLKDGGFWVAGASEHAHADIWHAPLEGRIALVCGNEAEGISRIVGEQCDFLVALPQRGQVESLNVAQATTAVCYEWLRRVMGREEREAKAAVKPAGESR